MKMGNSARVLITLLTATLLLTACAVDESDETANDLRSPVAFDTYVQGSTTRSSQPSPAATRSSQTGVMSTTEVQASGFGVFAFYNASSPITTAPDFMCNQWVQYDATLSHPWHYTPVKYWPNTPGDHLSFFAYAPYVAAPSSSTPGITALSTKSDTGDPTVTYAVATTLDNTVDLLWADPIIDQTKQAIGENVKFTFRHALAAINMRVQAMVDKENDLANPSDVSSSTIGLGTNHKITIKSVTVQGTDETKNYLYAGGTLNLNATATPNWTSKRDPAAPKANFALSLPTADITSSLQDNFTAEAGFPGLNLGVTEAAQQPLINAAPRYFMVIPTLPATASDDGKRTLQVTMTYYITSKDENLSDGYSRSENTVTSTITGIALAAGKIYNLNFVLGLQTFQMNVTSVSWDTPPDTEHSEDVTITYERGTSASSSLAPPRLHSEK